jgi:EmrB/QacA subfamily drug resistance transporter
MKQTVSPPDRDPVHPIGARPAAALTERRKFAVLVIAAATSSLIMLDTNVVAVSLPSIARDLQAGFTGVQWVISAYLITFAALLLPSGSFADLHGRRKIVMAGLVVFLVSSAACGLARGVIALDVARAVQGVGGAMLLTSALAIITSTFKGPERAKAFAFWGTCLGIAITLGPIAGGVITGLFGWRWAFLINVPLCIVFLITVRAYVPESRDPDALRMDVAGVVTLSLGLFGLISALIDGNDVGWTSPSIVARLGAAVVFLAAFVAVERMQTRPMLDLTLFRRPMLLGAASAVFGYGASAQVMIFFLPIYVQGAFGFAPLAAGFAMLPFAVPLFVAPRVAEVALRGRPFRTALMVGLGITLTGNLLLGLLAQRQSYVLAAVAMIVAGTGTGMLNPETAKAMQAQIASDRAGMASGIGATIRFTSLLLGVAILGAIMAHFHPRFTAGGSASAAPGFAAVAFTAAALGLLALGGVAVLMRPRATV